MTWLLIAWHAFLYLSLGVMTMRRGSDIVTFHGKKIWPKWCKVLSILVWPVDILMSIYDEVLR